MASEVRGLGRGLGALLGAELSVSPSRGGGTLPVSLMRPGAFQPRRGIQQEPLEELAASIKANGVLQPIVIRPLPVPLRDGARYEIIAGERRWQAAKLAGLKDIPAIVRDLSDREAALVALIGNIQREELTSAEEARAFKRLVEEFSLTHQEIAELVGRSRTAVTNLMRLLELPPEVVALIDDRMLAMDMRGRSSAWRAMRIACGSVGWLPPAATRCARPSSSCARRWRRTRTRAKSRWRPSSASS